MSVVRIIDAEPQADGLLALLEHMVDEVSKGHVSSLAICSVYRDGSPDWCFSYLPSRPAMLGTVEMMKADMMGLGE